MPTQSDCCTTNKIIRNVTTSIKYDFFKNEGRLLRSLYINDYQDKIKRTRNYSHVTSPYK